MRGPGYAHNPHSPLVPWAAIASRTLLQVGTGSLGGYVVGHPAVSVSEALRGWSVGLDGGVQALEGLVSDVHIGAESGSVSAGWIAEPGTGTFSNPTFGTVHLKPRTLAGAVHMSGRLFNQGPLAESLVKSSLQREAGKLFDRAIFNGTGGDEPTGILNTSGVNSLTGTGLDLADLLDEQQQIASAGVVDANHRWIGNPHMRELLGGREKSSGSGKYLWEDDRVLNRPAVVSNEIPAASITHGDLSQCVLGLWGGGFELGFDPYSNGNFQAFRYSVRVLLSADVGVLQPTALRSIEGIT